MMAYRRPLVVVEVVVEVPSSLGLVALAAGSN